MPILQLASGARAATRSAHRAADLRLVERFADPARQIAGVEEGEPDAGRTRGFPEGLSHHVGVVVTIPAGCVVEVVELTDAGHAGQRHLGVDGGREPPVRVGIEPGGDLVHALSPRPESPAAGMGASAQCAMEDVGVGIGEAGQDDPVQTSVARLRIHADVNGGHDAVVGGQAHPLGWPVSKPGALAPKGRH